MQTDRYKQTKLQQQQDYNEDFETLQESAIIANNRSIVRQMNSRVDYGNRQQRQQNQFMEGGEGGREKGNFGQGVQMKKSVILDNNNDVGKETNNLQTRQDNFQPINQFSQPNQTAQPHKTTKKQQDRQSLIKDTIERITKNINFSKQSIVEDISSIKYYEQLNQKELKSQYEQGSRVKKSGFSINKKQEVVHGKKAEVKQKMIVPLQQERVEKVMKTKIAEKLRQEQKVKQTQKRRNRQIYEQQKQARKQQELLQKNQSRIKKNQIEKRIIYEQKFISRRSGSPQIPISNQEIKAFQDAFIQQIKERLNIGKSKKKGKPLSPEKEVKQVRVDARKNYHKINKGEKLKEKIIMNLKQKIQKELEPTYESILADSKQFQNPSTPERKRGHQSAPQLRLPALSPTKPQRRTFYSKQQPNQRIHILKLSKNHEE